MGKLSSAERRERRETRPDYSFTGHGCLVQDLVHGCLGVWCIGVCYSQDAVKMHGEILSAQVGIRFDASMVSSL